MCKFPFPTLRFCGQKTFVKRSKVLYLYCTGELIAAGSPGKRGVSKSYCAPLFCFKLNYVVQK